MRWLKGASTHDSELNSFCRFNPFGSGVAHRSDKRQLETVCTEVRQVSAIIDAPKNVSLEQKCQKAKPLKNEGGEAHSSAAADFGSGCSAAAAVLCHPRKPYDP